MRLSKWLQKPSMGVQPRAERRPVKGLVAYYRSGMQLKEVEIRDISASGFYVVTSERWVQDELVNFTLQREGPPERDQQRRASIQAKSVWWGEDGVGLDFVLNNEIEFNLWAGSLSGTDGEPEPEDVIREFRVLEALSFLAQICPERVKELTQLFRREFSNSRILMGVNIALEAGRTLTFRPDVEQLHVHPDLLMKLMDSGSWSEDESVVRYWSGLLIASCKIGESSDENLVYVEPLSQLLSKHVRILTAACARAKLTLAADGSVNAETTTVPFEEITHITGARDISKNERDMAHLFLMGLLDDRKRSLALLPVDEANLTPTPFGLEFYARCKGHAGPIREFYGLSALQPASASAPAPAEAPAVEEGEQDSSPETEA